MKRRTITYLTDANLITCVIQKDLAEPVLEAAKNAGAQSLPEFVRNTMKITSKIMTKTAYYL